MLKVIQTHINDGPKDVLSHNSKAVSKANDKSLSPWRASLEGRSLPSASV